MFAPRRTLVAVKDPRSRSLPAVKKAPQLEQLFDAELELFRRAGQDRQQGHAPARGQANR
jgi:hypothetical protein